MIEGTATPAQLASLLGYRNPHDRRGASCSARRPVENGRRHAGLRHRGRGVGNRDHDGGDRRAGGRDRPQGRRRAGRHVLGHFDLVRVLGPLGLRMESLGDAELAFFRTIAKIVLGFVNDVPPKVAIDQARRGVASEVRPRGRTRSVVQRRRSRLTAHDDAGRRLRRKAGRRWQRWWWCMESRLRGLRDRDDGLLSRDVDRRPGQAGQASHRQILQRPERHLDRPGKAKRLCRSRAAARSPSPRPPPRFVPPREWAAPKQDEESERPASPRCRLCKNGESTVGTLIPFAEESAELDAPRQADLRQAHSRPGRQIVEDRDSRPRLRRPSRRAAIPGRLATFVCPAAWPRCNTWPKKASPPAACG